MFHASTVQSGYTPSNISLNVNSTTTSSGITSTINIRVDNSETTTVIDNSGTTTRIIPIDVAPEITSPTPITPPPNYDDVMTGNIKPPSYESQALTSPLVVQQPTTNIQTDAVRNTHYTTSRRNDNTDIGYECEPFYNPDTNSFLVCLLCNLFCRPITCCLHCCEDVCEDCCADTNPNPVRRNRYLNDNTIYTPNNYYDDYTTTASFVGGGGQDYGGGNDDGGVDVEWGRFTEISSLGGNNDADDCCRNDEGGDCGGNDGGDCGGDTGGGGDCGGDTGGGGDCGGDTGGGGDCGGDSGGGCCDD